MHRLAAELRPQGAPVRDPFAWREALSGNNTPVSTARSSCVGSRASGSRASTPRSATPPSARSHLSARSCGSVRSGCSPSTAPAAASGYPACPASPFDGLSGRTSNYATPEVSARSSEFVSVYDTSSSACASARAAELGAPHETQPPRRADEAGTIRRRHHAYAAAFDAFVASDGASGSAGAAASGAAAAAESQPEFSLDPVKVFSTARHGKHRDVEGSLVGGFDPNYKDQFGNTLFHVACQNGSKRIAKLAIKYGGDMDAQNIKGNTGLHFLFAYGYPDVAEYFIGKGASEHVQNEAGKTAREGIK